MSGSDSWRDWRYDGLSGESITTAHVARRLGLAPPTVRHYAQVLERRGYPIRRTPEGEALWPPEMVELLRVAHAAARAASPRLSIEETLDLLERVARYTQARPGGTLPELVARVEASLGGLRAEREALRGVVGEVREEVRKALLEEKASSVHDLNAAREALRTARQALLDAEVGMWGPFFLAVGGLIVLAALYAFRVDLPLLYILMAVMAGAVAGYWLRG